MTPNETFLKVISSAFLEISSKNDESLKSSIGLLYHLLNTCNFSDECFDGVREQIKNEIDGLGAAINDDDDDLDIGRPVINHSLPQKDPKKILTQELRIIAEIFESADYVTKKQLLDNELVNVLIDLDTRLVQIFRRIKLSSCLLYSTCGGYKTRKVVTYNTLNSAKK